MKKEITKNIAVNEKELSLNAIFNNLQSETKGLLKSSLGNKKEQIYKKELFKDMDEKSIKKMRKKIRNTTFSLLSSIIETKEKKLIDSFKEFYQQVYCINDFSFASIASENTKDTKKEVLIKGLEIVKNFK